MNTWEKFLQGIRQRYSLEAIRELFCEVAKKKILVVGETIVDEYSYVQLMGKSPKGNLIATKFLRKKKFMGGILACANHVAGLCDEVTLVTCLGKKRTMERSIGRNLKPNIQRKFFCRPDAPTTLNKRFIDADSGNKLLGVYHFEHGTIPGNTEESVLAFLGASISQYDVVLVVDYGHGFFTNQIVSLICDKAKFLALNVQTNSTNFGFNPIYRFPRADYICLDELEARLAEYNRFGDLAQTAIQISEKMSCPRVGITLGKNGAFFYDREEEFLSIPARPTESLDTVGTGDAYLSITAPCVATGAPTDLTGFIGAIAGSLASEILCNEKAVELHEIEETFRRVLQ